MRKLIAVITAGLTLAGVVACANKGGDGDRGAGGPVTPSPIAITVNPSALPVGDTTPRPDDQYPLITVYDANGRTLAAGRIRRGATEPQGDG
jgi:hypothetical protein